MSWRLSRACLPRASASSTLTLPSAKYSDNGTRAKLPSRILPTKVSIWRRCNSSLRLRRGSWLVQLPCRYSGMCALRSHTSPSSMVANESASDACPSRRLFTSVPCSATPASNTSMIE
ncbi:Uncharacterised protein [Mycobacterium tuberculosis]|uniref:Uncharacterized protein n=1 Tax=Mycobacterium tuberculosis TaxID=1773 RepID=A0A916LGH0_MYCTX|nr:Uncharacterised protein [Mycobacterium tuberculosis]